MRTSKYSSPVLKHDVYDGDTVRMELDVGYYFHAFLSARVHGVDTAEMRPSKTKTPHHALHVEVAKLSKEVVSCWLDEASTTGDLMFVSIARDKYSGRAVGDFYLFGRYDEPSLSDYLLAHCLAHPYSGGKKQAFTKEWLESAKTRAQELLGHTDGVLAAGAELLD